MMVRISFAYNFKPKPEQWEALRKSVEGLPEQMPEHFYGSEKYIADLPAVLATGLEGVTVHPAESSTVFWDAQAKRSQWERTRSPSGADGSVQIRIPGMGLMAINRVQVRENACTVDIQREMNDGWRILAIIPPREQRRPDYIMGRTIEDGSD